jgi:2-C-methyl-D-erythritol 2,4-cyclodiphosphate synthase
VLLGHSDGDAVLHAVADALLGVTGLGDIGVLFPPGDPATRGIDSSTLLRDVMHRVRDAEWAPSNVDITVITERPRIAPRAAEMRAVLADILGLEPSFVSLKGKTNEGLDGVGRGEAVAVHTVALLVRTQWRFLTQTEA